MTLDVDKLTDDVKMPTEAEQFALEIEAIECWKYDDESNEPPICAICCCEYRFEDDCRQEPTPCCDGCAQRMVAKLVVEMRRLQIEVDALRDPPHAFNCQACNSVIEVERVTCSRCVDNGRQVAEANEVSP